MKKKALSNLVAYVLLIAITISLSVLVYGWLKSYVDGEDTRECPDGINLVIDSYKCYSGAGGNLTVNLKNNGLFDVDGFILRVHNRTGAEFGFYLLGGEELKSLSPRDNYTRSYQFDNSGGDNPSGITDVKIVDVQPFLLDDEKIVCDAYASQKVVCNP